MSQKNCPCCPGQGQLLGAFGRTRHYRCRDCGMTFTSTPKRRAPRAAKEAA